MRQDSIGFYKNNTNSRFWTSLVAQGLRIRLPVQGTWVWSLVLEDPMCHQATMPVLHNRRSHHNEKPTQLNRKEPPLTATRESLCAATKTQCSPQIKLFLKSTSCFGEVCLLTAETTVPAGGDARVGSLGPIPPYFWTDTLEQRRVSITLWPNLSSETFTGR